MVFEGGGEEVDGLVVQMVVREMQGPQQVVVRQQPPTEPPTALWALMAAIRLRWCLCARAARAAFSPFRPR
jgi:hypothetical protein